MTLSGVHDHHLCLAAGYEDFLARQNRFAKHGHVVAERLSEASGFKEVSLHVDHD